MMAGCCCAEACTAAVVIGVMRLPVCPFDSAWCLVFDKEYIPLTLTSHVILSVHNLHKTVFCVNLAQRQPLHDPHAMPYVVQIDDANQWSQ